MTKEILGGQKVLKCGRARHHGPQRPKVDGPPGPIASCDQIPRAA